MTFFPLYEGTKNATDIVHYSLSPDLSFGYRERAGSNYWVWRAGTNVWFLVPIANMTPPLLKKSYTIRPLPWGRALVGAERIEASRKGRMVFGSRQLKIILAQIV